MKSLQHTIKAVIRPGEESGYVAECVEIAVVTQGSSLDQVMRNLQEAVRRLSAAEVVVILQQFGFFLLTQRGSHIKMRRNYFDWCEGNLDGAQPPRTRHRHLPRNLPTGVQIYIC